MLAGAAVSGVVRDAQVHWPRVRGAVRPLPGPGGFARPRDLEL